MKQMNRKKVIKDYETFRQGFADILDFIVPSMTDDLLKQIAATTAFESLHRLADKRVVELGGESVKRKYKKR